MVMDIVGDTLDNVAWAVGIPDDIRVLIGYEPPYFIGYEPLVWRVEVCSSQCVWDLWKERHVERVAASSERSGSLQTQLLRVCNIGEDFR